MLSTWSKLLSCLNVRKTTGIQASQSVYNTWSRRQLIDRVTFLESNLRLQQQQQQQQRHKKTPSFCDNIKKRKVFDMNQYPQQRVALKVAYLGWNYLGFASQKETDQTVEAELFKALRHCKLIQDAQSCQFTRCGRTDKGVSGLGQVIALNVRQSKSTQPPIPYVETLNAVLPDDIRVLAWSHAPPDFNARFDCISRTYRYMFMKQDLDLDAMQEAASLMVGTYDFRNFCKLDPSKQLNYQRTILAIDILPTAKINETDNDIHGAGDCYQVQIKGTAFLWHQVRCIMSILFLVGQRLESPNIVKDLLDIEKVTAKPDYPLASDIPLLLYDCEFKGLNWQYGLRPHRLQQHWEGLLYDQTVRAWLYHTFAQSLSDHPQPSPPSTMHTPKSISNIVLGAGKAIRTTSYRPLLERARADSEEVKRSKYEAKLERRKTSQHH